MKSLILIYAILILTNFVHGQSQESFDKLISKTNKHLVQYSKLSPFDDEYISIKNLGLAKKEIEDLLKEADYDATLSNNKDSIAAYHMIGYFQDRIFDDINGLIAHNKFKENDIIELLEVDETDLSIIASDDRKMYNFSLDEKTGGTYRSRISIMHYTEIEQDRLSSQKDLDNGSRINPYAIFEGDGFSEIYSIDSKEGTKYVLTGYVRGCSYCFETNIILVKFEDGIFQEDFAYSVNLRDWEGGAEYNSETKTIIVNYTTDDLTAECDCTNYAILEEDRADYSIDDEDNPIRKRCHCTFEFNGLNFELTKACWETLKE